MLAVHFKFHHRSISPSLDGEKRKKKKNARKKMVQKTTHTPTYPLIHPPTYPFGLVLGRLCHPPPPDFPRPSPLRWCPPHRSGPFGPPAAAPPVARIHQPQGAYQQRDQMAMGFSKPEARSPVNIRFNPTTKIGSKMGGEFTYSRIVPLVLTHSQMSYNRNPVFKWS